MTTGTTTHAFADPTKSIHNAPAPLGAGLSIPRTPPASTPSTFGRGFSACQFQNNSPPLDGRSGDPLLNRIS